MPTYSAWPFDCPRSWSEKKHPSLLRSEVDDGFPKVRRRFTKTWSEVSVNFRIGWTQRDAFDHFVEVDCGAGAIPFTIKDPYTGAIRTARWKEPPTVAGSPDTKPTIDISATLEMIL
jgi:hypothetical protein